MDAAAAAPRPQDEPDAAGVPPAPPEPPLATLERTALEVERHVATDGWGAPPRVFALVRTAQALAADAALAAHLPPEVLAEAEADPEHLTSVEQDELPEGSLEEVLAQIGWPPAVAGAALAVERVVVPPDVDLPEDPAAALAVVDAHPDRHEVRIAVAVLREEGPGTTGTVVRRREDDDDLRVVVGEDLVPGLAAALRATFA